MSPGIAYPGPRSLNTQFNIDAFTLWPATPSVFVVDKQPYPGIAYPAPLRLSSVFSVADYLNNIPGNLLTSGGSVPVGPYLPLTGGTLTGPLIGTTAQFSNSVQAIDGFDANGSVYGPTKVFVNGTNTDSIKTLGGIQTENAVLVGATTAYNTNSIVLDTDKFTVDALGNGALAGTLNVTGVATTAGVITGSVAATGNITSGGNVTANTGSGIITGKIVIADSSSNSAVLARTGGVTGKTGCFAVDASDSSELRPTSLRVGTGGTGTVNCGTVTCGPLTSSGLVTCAGIDSTAGPITATKLFATSVAADAIATLGGIIATKDIVGFNLGANGDLVCLGSISGGPLNCGAISSTGQFTCGTNSALTGAINQSINEGTLQTGNILGGSIFNRVNLNASGFNPISQLGFFASTITNGLLGSGVTINTTSTDIHTFLLAEAGYYIVSFFLNTISPGFCEQYSVSVAGSGSVLNSSFMGSSSGVPVLTLSVGSASNVLAATRTGAAGQYYISLTRTM
jgi:hypothetical protein